MRVSRKRRVTLAIIGALMVALAALISYGYRQDINAARARVSSGSQEDQRTVPHLTCPAGKSVTHPGPRP